MDHVQEDPEPLTELSRLAGARSDLDRRERLLIEAARLQGVSWSRIAAALGLRSRQAAEQRWLRLCAENVRDPAQTRAARLRQQAADKSYGAPIVRLREAVLEAHRSIQEDKDWDQRHPRAALVRMGLAMAVPAEPRALFELAAQAVGDLDTSPWPALPTPLASRLRRLRLALTAATPSG